MESFTVMNWLIGMDCHPALYEYKMGEEIVTLVPTHPSRVYVDYFSSVVFVYRALSPLLLASGPPESPLGDHLKVSGVGVKWDACWGILLLLT